MYLFPFLGLLAVVASAVLLVVLRRFGDLTGHAFVFCFAVFLLAVYCQFLGSTPVIAAAGRGLQTLLAIALLLRWRLTR